MKIKHFFSKVAGVSHKNADGTHRQAIINDCKSGERLDLKYDKDNKYSDYAVEVCRQSGEQLGYLNNRISKEIFEKCQRNYKFAVFIANITGGAGKTGGVNILMVEVPPGVSESKVQPYLNTIDLGNREDSEPIKESSVPKWVWIIGCIILLWWLLKL